MFLAHSYIHINVETGAMDFSLTCKFITTHSNQREAWPIVFSFFYYCFLVSLLLLLFSIMTCFYFFFFLYSQSGDCSGWQRREYGPPTFVFLFPIRSTQGLVQVFSRQRRRRVRGRGVVKDPWTVVWRHPRV